MVNFHPYSSHFIFHKTVCQENHDFLNHFQQVFGSITKPLIEAVQLRHSKPLNSDVNDSESLEDLRLLFIENGDPSDQDNSTNNRTTRRASSLRLLMTYPTTTVHYLWRKFDDRFMRPVFGGRGFVPYVPSSPTGEEEETGQAS